jgi:hypothetical protein
MPERTQILMYQQLIIQLPKTKHHVPKDYVQSPGCYPTAWKSSCVLKLVDQLRYPEGSNFVIAGKRFEALWRRRNLMISR